MSFSQMLAPTPKRAVVRFRIAKYYTSALLTCITVRPFAMHYLAATLSHATTNRRLLSMHRFRSSLALVLLA
ncbi:MAG: hypothetical protein ACREMY_02430, partial [bacterium]